MPRLNRRGGGASDRKDIFDRVDVSADYVDEDTGSTFLNFDCTSGPINYTPPTLTSFDKGVVKIIKDAKGFSATNKITILATITGEETPVVGTNYGSLEIRWNGTAWERLREERNLWDYDEITKTLQPKDPFTLFANAIKGGTKAVIKSQEYSDLSNPGLNVNDNGSSFGNLLQAGEDDETDGKPVLYSGGASANGHDDNASTYDYPTDSTNFATGLIYDFDFGAGGEKQVNELFVDVSGGSVYYFDYQVSWSDDGVVWSPIFEHTTDIYNSNDRIFQFINSVGAKRHWRVAISMPYGGAEIQKKVQNIKLRVNDYATTSNTIETNFGESNKTISGLKAYDENGDLITDETRVLVEYSTDNKTSWSTQETLASFNASDNVVSGGIFEVRFAAVGDQRISRIDRIGPNSVLEASETGFSFSIDGLNEFNFDSTNGIQARKVSIGENGSFLDVTESGIVFKKDGQNLFEFSEENGVEVEGLSLNSRLDAIENNPTEEVADIAARDALNPVDGDIVKVLNDGNGVTKVYKYDATGTQWNDISNLFGSAGLTAANAAQVDANQAVQDAQTAASDAAQAVSTADAADDKADTAIASADQALLTAQTAQTDATQALSDAATADGKAVAAQTTANQAQADATQALSDAAAAQATADAAGGATFHYPVLRTQNFTQGNTSSVVEAEVHGDLDLFDHDSLLKVDLFMEIVGTTRRILIKGDLNFANKEIWPNDMCDKFGKADVYISDKEGGEWVLKEHCTLHANAGHANYQNVITFQEFYVVSPSTNLPTSSGHILTQLTAKLKNVSSKMYLEVTATYDTLNNSAGQDSQLKLQSQASEF